MKNVYEMEVLLCNYEKYFRLAEIIIDGVRSFAKIKSVCLTPSCVAYLIVNVTTKYGLLFEMFLKVADIFDHTQL